MDSYIRKAVLRLRCQEPEYLLLVTYILASQPGDKRSSSCVTRVPATPGEDTTPGHQGSSLPSLNRAGRKLCDPQ
ncbi:T0119928 isoform 5 [Pongo abelii]|uniref:T0119928 isoform 5 n=1 Tax=Pongo abelii TaxID=9601 RepID=A0A2J8XWP2_PONAB|nr:T0119928 isoform 5 [Pongo abelii]